MGHVVDRYSLSELHRISGPGAVPPCLFWALPVADWHRSELHETWRWFTEKPNECYDLGLLLVKNLVGHESEVEARLSLAPLGAKLSEVMPTGTERFVRSSAYGGRSPRMLVLSGGYPQPGWGVLVEWQNIHLFENLVKRTTSRLNQAGAGKDLNLFKTAADSFHGLRALTRPAKPELSRFTDELHAASRVESFTHEALDALRTGELRLVGEKLIAIIDGSRKAAWLQILDASLQQLLNTQRTLLTADSITALSEELFATEVEPKLRAVAADPSQKEAAFRSISNDKVKRAFKGCLYLRANSMLRETESFPVWAKTILADVTPKLEADLASLSKDITAKLMANVVKWPNKNMNTPLP